MEETNKMLYTLVFLFIGIIGICIPLVLGLSGVVTTTGSQITENWTGTAGVATLLTYPITSVVLSTKASPASASNTTALNGAVGTRQVILQPIVFPSSFILGTSYEIDPEDFINVSANGCFLGNFTGFPITVTNQSCETSPISITFDAIKETLHTTTNSTGIDGANGDVNVPMYSPFVDDRDFNITVTYDYDVDAGDGVSVSIGLDTLGNLSGSGSDTWSGILGSELSNPLVVTFVNNGTGTNITGVSATYYIFQAATSNITNVSILYQRYTTYSNYTLNSGRITPASSGNFRTTYTYGNSSPIIFVVLSIIPIALGLLVIAAVFMYLKVKD